MPGNLIHNERAKLRANALDRASTACLTGGVVGPVAAILFTEARPDGGILLLAFLASAVAARSLHELAVKTLGQLREEP